MKLNAAHLAPFMLILLLNSKLGSCKPPVLKSLLSSKTNLIGPDVEDFCDSVPKSSRIDSMLQNLYDSLNRAKCDLLDPSQWPPDSANGFSNNAEYDYIVVGAGSAGSVVASRLSEDPNVTVLVLEAGGNPPIESEIFSLSLLLTNTPYFWNDYAQANPNCCQAMRNGQCYWPRGKMLGGTGGVNGNVFLMGMPEDFDDWQQQGNNGWSWHDVSPFYVKATQNETQDLNSLNESPIKGSLTLNQFQRLESYGILRDLMQSTEQDLKEKGQEGRLKFQEDIMATVERGTRMSTGKTYLGRVAKYRKNLHVIKQAEVTKININPRYLKAQGVEFTLNKKLFVLQASARREIILSAGAFNSPKLLMLSGVGPEEHLRSQNIPLVKNLPVGENLQDHGMMPLMFKFTRNIPELNETPEIEATFDYFIRQAGPLASGETLVGFLSSLMPSKQITPTADVMLVAQISKPTANSNTFQFLQFKDEIVEGFVASAENQTILQVQALIIKSQSRGSVKLKSNNPLDTLRITNNYGQAQEDRNKLLRFIRFMQELATMSTFEYYGLELIRIPVHECDAGFPYNSDGYWLCYIKYFYISAWHAVGTCRMAPRRDATAVVDNRLRVHGIQGLRVIDASIMPNITSANTNGPTIMIAEKGAKMLQEDWLQNTILR